MHACMYVCINTSLHVLHLVEKLPKLKEDFLEDMLSLLPYIIVGDE